MPETRRVVACVDCDGDIMEDDADELVNGHGPLCAPCYRAYPTEDDPEVRAEVAAHVEANRQRWEASWAALDG